MINAPKVSVVIPTRCRPDLLARCLDRLTPGAQSLQSREYEVIIADDGDPNVQELLAKRYPWALWVPGPKCGPAANRNAGARQGRGDWIAFTDDDCVPDPDWLERFLGAVHGGCRVYEGKTTCAAGLKSPLEQSPVNITGGCLWSCNIFISRATFEEVGGFDENFPFPYMEDADLGDRLTKAGYSFSFVPLAVVDHPPRPMAPGRRLGRHHESWMYFWYKRGFSKLATPRLLNLIVKARVKSILAHKIGFDSLLALQSLVAEVCTMIPRLPIWELRHRRRFLHRPRG